MGRCLYFTFCLSCPVLLQQPLGNKDRWVVVTSEYILMYAFFAFLFSPDWAMKIELWLSFLTWSCIISPGHYSGMVLLQGLGYWPFLLHVLTWLRFVSRGQVSQCLVISPSDMCVVPSLTQCAFNYYSIIILEVLPNSFMIVDTVHNSPSCNATVPTLSA